MKKTLITKQVFKVMPWKNGAGTTAEIDIDPPGSDFRQGTFNWRLSSARIEDENRFSKFPGYDRILTILSGEGLLLDNEELGPFEVFEFQGEEEIDCALIRNPVEDLGVIFKRGKYRCSMQILEVSAPMYLKLESAIHFFLPLSLQVNVAGTDLRPTEFLKIEDATNVEITAKIFPAHLLRIEISEIKQT